MLRLLPLVATGIGACAPHVAPSGIMETPLRRRADLHVHLAMKRSVFFFSGESGRGVLATSPTQRLINQVDAATLRRAGIRVVGAALWPTPALRPGRDRLAEALVQLDELEHFARSHRDFGLALDARSARRIISTGGIALIPSLEGAAAIASVADVDALFAAGMRIVDLAHFSDNAVAGARNDQLGSLFGRVLNGPVDGLTPLGREVVTRLFELGVVVDVDHCSAGTVEDVLELAEAHHVPIVASHVGASIQGRTLEARHARRILALGGLIGVGVYQHSRLAPVPEDETWPGYVERTCDDVIAHWVHYASLGDETRVVLGSDFNSLGTRPLPGGHCPDGIRSAGDLPALFTALEARGIGRAALEGSEERFLALLEAVEARSNPEARAAASSKRPARPDSFAVP